MGAKVFLQKLINMRNATIARGVCGKPVVGELKTISEVRSWMDFYNPTEQQVISYIKRNTDKIELLLPGGKTPQAESWRRKYEALLQ